MPAVIDTSAVLAAVDRQDPAHGEVVHSLAGERSTILLPIVALPEIAFLLHNRHGALVAAQVIGRIVKGAWPIECLEAADLERASELMARDADSGVGFVDAGIAALAERVGAARIYTLDRRDFTILRPRHVDAFEVLPAG